MERIIYVTNGLSVLAFAAFLVLIFLFKKEGRDERARYMGYRLFSFLFAFLLGGLSLIIFITGTEAFTYIQLRVSITALMSLNLLAGLGYWLYLRKTV
ncbi:hypothetical protein V1498_04000 [Peribacillus sp. SCS-26]|uniref:hypothetical protein n=1 Tax=Paraperibacillus marinus TaxID=3115295 RepID=UPI003906C041